MRNIISVISRAGRSSLTRRTGKTKISEHTTLDLSGGIRPTGAGQNSSPKEREKIKDRNGQDQELFYHSNTYVPPDLLQKPKVKTIKLREVNK